MQICMVIEIGNFGASLPINPRPVPEHGLAQDRIQPGLISPPLGLQPMQHIGIDPYRSRLLDGTVEDAAPGVRPIEAGGDIGIIDIGVIHRRQSLKLRLAGLGQRRWILGVDPIFDQFTAHNAAFLYCPRAGRK